MDSFPAAHWVISSSHIQSIIKIPNREERRWHNQPTTQVQTSPKQAPQRAQNVYSDEMNSTNIEIQKIFFFLPAQVRSKELR